MNKSTQTMLYVAGGAAVLYYLYTQMKGSSGGGLLTSAQANTLARGGVCPAAASGPNSDMGGQNFGVCPSGGWSC